MSEHRDEPTVPKPPPCTVLAENIPAELKARMQWVCWRWTWKRLKKGKPGKWDKPLFSCRTGKHASSTDAETWGSFDDAFMAYSYPANRYDGIGYVFSGDPDDFVGVDLDKCRDLLSGGIRSWSGEQRSCKHWSKTAPEPREIIDTIGSYAEVSPSQTGVKLFVRASIESGMKHGCVEMYRRGRYFTVTGHKLPGTPPGIRQCDLLEEIRAQFDCLEKKESHAKRNNPSAATDQPIPSAGQAPALDQVVAACYNAVNGDKFRRLFDGDFSGYPSQSEAELALCGVAAFWSGGQAAVIDELYRQSKLARDKWDETRGAQTYGQRTIAAALERCTEFYDWNRSTGTRSTQCGSFAIGDLKLVIKSARRTATKIAVSLQIVRNGIPIDLLRLTDATHSRRQAAKQIAAKLAGTELPDRVNDVLGSVLLEAERTASQSSTNTGNTVYAILHEYVGKEIALQYSVEGGKAYSATMKEAIGRSGFIERFLRNTVIQLASTASDAPRDDGGNVKRSSLIALVEKELKLLWAEMVSALKTLDEVELPSSCPAADEFRQSIITIWIKPTSMGLHRQRIETGSARGEAVQLATRNSLASRVRRLLLESPSAIANCWFCVQEGFDAYVRQQSGPAPGETQTMLAMRYELAHQIGVQIPDVTNQTALRRRATKFGTSEVDSSVPDRMTGGERLFVLSPSLVGKILAQPDESPVTDEGASDRCAPLEPLVSVTGAERNSRPVTDENGSICHSVTE